MGARKKLVGNTEDVFKLAGQSKVSSIKFRPKKPKQKSPLGPPTVRELRRMVRYLKQPCENLDNSDDCGTNKDEVKNSLDGVEEVLHHLRRAVNDGNVRAMSHLFGELIGWAKIGEGTLAGYESLGE